MSFEYFNKKYKVDKIKVYTENKTDVRETTVRELLLSYFKKEIENKNIVVPSGEVSAEVLLEALIDTIANSSSDTIDDVVEIEELDADERSVYEFITLVGVAGAFNNTAMNLFSEAKKDRLIGYADCYKPIQDYIRVNTGEDNTKTEQKINTNLFSNTRKASQSEYFSAKVNNAGRHYYDVDIDRVTEIFNVSKPVASSLWQQMKKTYGQPQGIIEKALGFIKDHYTRLLKSSYGMRDIYGVYTVEGEGDNAVQAILRTNPIGEKIYTPYTSLFSYNDDKNIFSFYNVKPKISDSRFFDPQELYDNYKNCNDTPIPVYYPNKILEIVSKREYGHKLVQNEKESVTFQNEDYIEMAEKVDANTGKTSRDNQNINTLISYLMKHFEQDLYSCIYTLLEVKTVETLKQFVIGKNEDGTPSFKYDVENFISIDSYPSNKPLTKADQTELEKINADFTKEVSEYVAYLCKSFCTYVVLADVATKDGNISMFRIKYGCTTNKINNRENPAVLYIKSKSATYDEKLFESNFSKDISTTIVNVNLSTNFIEFAYKVDKKAYDGLPVFAYKTLDVLQRQNLLPNFENALLGRLDNGEMESVNLSKRVLHHVFAGSRSGKGVMSYNLMATAFGNGIPLFYLDRKPDTSVVFKILSNKKIFVIDGGQYDEDNDMTNDLVVGTKIPQEKKNTDLQIYQQYHTRKKGSEFSSLSDVTLNDLAYTRGLLLVLEMACMATEYKEGGKSVRLNNGLSKIDQKQFFALVVDEFTNLSNDTLMDTLKEGTSLYRLLNTDKETASDKIKKQADSLMSKSETKQIELDEANNDEKVKQSKVSKLNLELTQAKKDAEKALSALDKTIPYSKVYYSTLVSEIAQLYSYIINRSRAGGGFVLQNMQIFLLGQQMPWKGYDFYGETISNSTDGLFRTNADGTITQTQENKAFNPLYALLRATAKGVSQNGGMDVFLGANLGSADILQESFSDVTGKNNTNRYFLWYDFGVTSDKAMTDLESREDRTIQQDKGKKFKPFLILNNGESIPKYHEGGDNSDINNVDVRTSKEQAAVSLRSQNSGKKWRYVAQSIQVCMDAGLTWHDIYSDNMPDSEEDKAEENLNRKVGFAEYLEAYGKVIGNDNVIANMGLSGDIANNYVYYVYGYKGFNDSETPETNPHLAEDFCHDFRMKYALSFDFAKADVDDIDEARKSGYTDTLNSDRMKDWNPSCLKDFYSETKSDSLELYDAENREFLDALYSQDAPPIDYTGKWDTYSEEDVEIKGIDVNDTAEAEEKLKEVMADAKKESFDTIWSKYDRKIMGLIFTEVSPYMQKGYDSAYIQQKTTEVYDEVKKALEEIYNQQGAEAVTAMLEE